jgi:hypothetical protein
MTRWMMVFCAVAFFAGTAGASHVKVEAEKGHRGAATAGTVYTVRNEENFPVDVCLSDSLSGPEKIEMSPFTLERLDHGQWSPVAGRVATIHFTYELKSTWVESYPITIRDAGRYRVVLTYGRAAPDGKSCAALLNGLTREVRSRAFDVR